MAADQFGTRDVGAAAQLRSFALALHVSRLEWRNIDVGEPGKSLRLPSGGRAAGLCGGDGGLSGDRDNRTVFVFAR